MSPRFLLGLLPTETPVQGEEAVQGPWKCSTDGHEDRFQRFGFIVQFSLSSMRCHKLWWHYTRSHNGRSHRVGSWVLGKAVSQGVCHPGVSLQGLSQVTQEL